MRPRPVSCPSTGRAPRKPTGTPRADPRSRLPADSPYSRRPHSPSTDSTRRSAAPPTHISSLVRPSTAVVYRVEEAEGAPTGCFSGAPQRWAGLRAVLIVPAPTRPDYRRKKPNFAQPILHDGRALSYCDGFARSPEPHRSTDACQTFRGACGALPWPRAPASSDGQARARDGRGPELLRGLLRPPAAS